MMPSGISEFLEPSDISEFLEPTGLEVAPPLLPSGPYTNAFLFNAVEDDDSSGGGAALLAITRAIHTTSLRTAPTTS